MRHRFQPTRSLQFEQLEQRAVLNGSVEIIGHGGLSILGDNAANNIVICQVGKPSSNGAFINILIQGIGTKLLVAKPSNTTGFPTDFFPPRYSVLVTGVNSMDIRMGGGNDSVSFFNTTVPGTFSIDMGAGNDTLTMNNVHDLGPGFKAGPGMGVADQPALTRIDLGTGNDMAFLDNVSASVVLQVLGGDGTDTVTLSRVVGGTVKTVYPIGVISVNMGPGNSDNLAVLSCKSDETEFLDTAGTNGTLLKSGNQFGSELDDGFAHVVSI